MKPEKNGVPFVEGFGDGRPYQIWESDQWKCSGCGISVLIGFGRKPYSEHYQENFVHCLQLAVSDPFCVIEKPKKNEVA
jgi:hypothetical protein